MATQLTIFETPSTETADKICRLLAGQEPGAREMGIIQARQQQLSLWALLIRHIRTAHEKDFKKVWNGFERNGEMVYYKSQFGRAEIALLEDGDGQLCLNNSILYTSGPDDEFGDKLTDKYINYAAQHIKNNNIYFNNLINGIWKSNISIWTKLPCFKLERRKNSTRNGKDKNEN